MPHSSLGSLYAGTMMVTRQFDTGKLSALSVTTLLFFFFFFYPALGNHEIEAKVTFKKKRERVANSDLPLDYSTFKQITKEIRKLPSDPEKKKKV